jgi:hypothetical protein
MVVATSWLARLSSASSTDAADTAQRATRSARSSLVSVSRIGDVAVAACTKRPTNSDGTTWDAQSGDGAPWLAEIDRAVAAELVERNTARTVAAARRLAAGLGLQQDLAAAADADSGPARRHDLDIQPEYGQLIGQILGHQRVVDPEGQMPVQERRGGLGADVGIGIDGFRQRQHNAKQLPSPSALRSSISPPSKRARRRLMTSPKPLPPYLRLSAASACTNSVEQT